MNKPLIFGGGITLVALAVAPYFAGNGVESAVNSTIDSINEQVIYKANVVDYDKGWFSTTATINVAINIGAIMSAQQIDADEMPMDENPTMTVTFNAHHGPVYFGDGVGVGKVKYTLTIDGEELREYAVWDESKALYSNEGVVGLLGSLNFRDEIPSFSITSEEDGATVSFSGYRGEATPQGDTTVYKATSDLLSGEVEGAAFEMSSLSVDTIYSGDFVSALKGELFDSKVDMKIASMKVSGIEAESDITIDDITFIADTQVNKAADTANVYVEYAVGKVSGPDMDASDMVLGVAVNNIDADFMRAYQKFNNESMLMSPEQVPEKMMAFIQENLLSQLEAEPEINITKLTATVPEGSFSANANTKLVGITSLPGTMEDIGYWVSHLLADASITADKAFAESMMSGYMMGQIMANPQAQSMTPEEIQAAADQQAPMMIQSFVQQGLIKATEQGYETKITLKDGQADVNGTAIPLPFAPQ
jgi:uncharacterized protein YdgA (DUF945 family)